MHSHLAPNPDENFFLMYYIGHYVYLNKDLTVYSTLFNWFLSADLSFLMWDFTK